MENTHQFDVLVVYSQAIATSASSTSIDITTPFVAISSNTDYNTAYSYFLSVCEKYNLRAALTTTSDIIEAGTCKSYWLYENKAWIKVNNQCFAPLIFDKCSSVNMERAESLRLLFSSEKVTPFNDPYLLTLFHDKFKTYEELQQFAVPTINIHSSDENEIKKALLDIKALLNVHPNVSDFSSDLIVKDRNGAGGDQIYKITSRYVSQIQNIVKKNVGIKFALQPYVRFEKGFLYQNKPVLADIRLIFLKEKLVQSYIRMAQKDEFRCNEHKGGILEYITETNIPKKVIEQAREILAQLTTKSSLFALDFIISNNGNVLFLEGNIKPGLYWNLSRKTEEKEAKKLIRIIVEELVKRSDLIKFERIKLRILPSETMYPPLII